MGLFERLFNKDNEQSEADKAMSSVEKAHSEWVELPSYVLVEKDEYSLPALIATVIAAGERPKSTFSIKQIKERNPEAQLVSVIAASLAAASEPKSTFIIQSIKKKRT